MKPHTQLRFTVNENSIYSMSYDVPLPCDLFRSFNLSNWTRCSLCYRGHGKFSASICLIFWDRATYYHPDHLSDKQYSVWCWLDGRFRSVQRKLMVFILKKLQRNFKSWNPMWSFYFPLIRAIQWQIGRFLCQSQWLSFWIRAVRWRFPSYFWRRGASLIDKPFNATEKVQMSTWTWL